MGFLRLGLCLLEPSSCDQWENKVSEKSVHTCCSLFSILNKCGVAVVGTGVAVKPWVELSFQDLQCGEEEQMEVGAEVTCMVFHRVMGSRGSRKVWGNWGWGCGGTWCSCDRLGNRLAGLLPTRTSIWRNICFVFLCHLLHYKHKRAAGNMLLIFPVLV